MYHILMILDIIKSTGASCLYANNVVVECDSDTFSVSVLTSVTNGTASSAVGIDDYTKFLDQIRVTEIDRYIIVTANIVNASNFNTLNARIVSSTSEMSRRSSIPEYDAIVTEMTLKGLS